MKISVKTNTDGVVIGYGICLTSDHNPLLDGSVIETDVDLESVVGNYRLADGIIELIPESERPTIQYPKTPIDVLRDDVNSTTLGMEITRTALTFKINQLQSMVEGLLPSALPQEG
jgi:hypothetical protein